MFWEAEEMSGKTWVLRTQPDKKMSKKRDEVKSTGLVID